MMVVPIKLINSLLLIWRNALHSPDSIEFYNSLSAKVIPNVTEYVLTDATANKLALEFKQLDLLKKPPVIQFMLIKDREGLDKPSSNSKEDKKVWMKAYISATQAPNSKFSSKQAALRADECLTLYKERFSK